jgi:hypothetical protein
MSLSMGFVAALLLQENLKLSPAMLSRFDVIFVLLDRPDELMDQALSEHIMALHSGECCSCVVSFVAEVTVVLHNTLCLKRAQ